MVLTGNICADDTELEIELDNFKYKNHLVARFTI